MNISRGPTPHLVAVLAAAASVGFPMVTPVHQAVPAQPAVVSHHVATDLTGDPSVERGTARCAPGEHLLSGGYEATDRVLRILDSYPSTSDGSAVGDGAAADSWTVQVRAGGPYGEAPSAAEVYAVCLIGGGDSRV